MQKYIILIAFLATAACHEPRKHRVDDPFSALDKHITHTLAYHYLWPWSQLIRAAAALDIEEALEEPQIVSDAEQLRVNLNVRRFKPDELRIKVKNRYIIVEGKHKETGDAQKFMANHFVQRFVLPPGSKQEEVTAVLKENGVLTVSVPKHELPPPPPEREVPIEVRLPEKVEEKPVEQDKTEKPVAEDKTETTTEKKEVPVQTSSATPLEQLDLVEATTHVGKIRKKELKPTPKTSKDNEVSKGLNGNGLDYALVEQEE
ncbi:hypothetical protein B5X24_HaOG208813 [Helicoverpa armigera]|uniref:SHSP domain-containing protein n=1 Tax=Helicoverpa armigera TaxID=29058 RepID=A0A2W1BJ96_HELAM|nr:protein lethal(2)essential for life-like [Helicoverpa armigera]XP_049692156.1 LOW QUALITY PROTEIN: protein lethal(2)essential for life-like [Helicoverpa armigera]PZC73754.1 hypothetical protein B5X24_HaOG208813 [Helicoverpa armigera]